jgi:ketosteroid isomerase-like protein
MHWIRNVKHTCPWKRLLALLPLASCAWATTPVPSAALPAATPSAATVVAQATVSAAMTLPPAAPTPEQQVRDRIESWAGAWLRGDPGDYLRHYAPEFKGDAPSRATWEKQRRQRLDNPDIQLDIEDLRVSVDHDQARADFIQRYESGGYSDSGRKQLVLERRGGQWLIVAEHWRPIR